MKNNEEPKSAVELVKRLAKRLPEIILIALLLYTGFCLWMETENAGYAMAFACRYLFGYLHELDYIPLFQKLLFTIPSLLLVLLFVEDIVKVSIKNELSSDELVSITKGANAS